MDQRVSEQLDKVLALVDSTHDAEAVVAIRMARQMLSRDGLNFSDLARAAHKPRANKSFSLFSGSQMHVEAQLVQLRQKLDDLQKDMNTQTFQINFWRGRATELEQNVHAARAEAERWRRMARETVEKLWALGQDISVEEIVSTPPVAEEPKQKTA